MGAGVYLGGLPFVVMRFGSNMVYAHMPLPPLPPPPLLPQLPPLPENLKKDEEMFTRLSKCLLRMRTELR